MAHALGPLVVCTTWRSPLREAFIDRVAAQAGSTEIVVVDNDDRRLLPEGCSAVIGMDCWAIHTFCGREMREIPICMIEFVSPHWREDAMDLDRHFPGHVVAHSADEWHAIVDEFMKSYTRRRAQIAQAYVTEMLGPTDTGDPTVWSETLVGLSGTRYTFERVLGMGGTATVALVRDERGAVFAAKALSGHRFPIDMTRERFAREGRLLADVSHPSVMRIVDEAVMEEETVLVMEYLVGGSLHQRLRDKGPVGPETGIRWLGDILSGLSALHDRSIIHRDITPKNLLFRANDHLVIGDFGTVRHLDDATLTSSSDRLGSLIYVPHEQFQAPHAVNFAADVYAAGQVGFLLLSGVTPQGNTGPLRRHADTIPPEIADVVEGMRAFDAADRPKNAGVALALLSSACNGQFALASQG